MDNKLLLLVSDDLIKGKGNRDGLVQQIITYVRDGRTVTRKQWVRSEFADHAKKNEDERRKSLLRQMERERKKHEKKVQVNEEKHEIEDRKGQRKLESKKKKEKEELYGKDETLRKLHIEASKRKQSDKVTKEVQTKSKKKDEDSNGNKRKDPLSSYGQKDYTRSDNKQTVNLATQYTPPTPKNPS